MCHCAKGLSLVTDAGTPCSWKVLNVKELMPLKVALSQYLSSIAPGEDLTLRCVFSNDSQNSPMGLSFSYSSDYGPDTIMG